jgi:putative ABC transport system ATP-binding protein
MSERNGTPIGPLEGSESALEHASRGDVTRPDAVELRRVTKSYERGFRALDEIDLRIAQGEFVAVTGPSGCGKSTMLHLIAALDTPSAGQVLVDGRDLLKIHDLSGYRRNHVGLVFQLHNLLASQPIVANVEAVMFGTRTAARERRARASELLAQVDLAGREHRLPTQLAGGERQRVAVARALANRPRLLLADEPTGSLDSASAVRILELIKQVHETGVTIVLVTHDLSIAAAADRTIHVRDGKVVEVAPANP